MPNADAYYNRGNAYHKQGLNKQARKYKLIIITF